MQLPIHCEVSKVNNRVQRYDIYPTYWRDNVAFWADNVTRDILAFVFCWFLCVCQIVRVSLMAIF